MKRVAVTVMTLFSLGLMGSGDIINEQYQVHKVHSIARQGSIRESLACNEIKKQDLYAMDVFCNTPLLYASFFSNIENIRYLVDQGVDINHRNKLSMTAIYVAVKYDKQESMIVLTELGAYTNDVRRITSNHQQEIIDAITLCK